MDYQGSVYYYDGYSNFMKGKSQWWGTNLEEGSGARRDWYEGYNHAMADHDSRMKREMQHSLTQVDTENQQLESLVSNPVAAWSGEGLPPVGCECEAYDGLEWYPAVVVGHYDGFAFAWNYDRRITFTVNEINASCFRPIRTEAERKREETIKEITLHVTNFNKTDVTHAIIEIYDDIAAGKIPHITLK